MKTPLYCLTPFFKFCSTPTLSAPTPTPTALFVVLFLWRNGWSRHIWCATLINHIMDPHVKPWYLVTEGPWCVFYGTRRQVYWVLTRDFLLVLWFDITQTQTHTEHPGASRLVHPYKYIFTPLVMRSQQPSSLHWMNNSLISKIYFPQCLLFSKIIHL